jgi:hypothetical protein
MICDDLASHEFCNTDTETIAQVLEATGRCVGGAGGADGTVPTPSHQPPTPRGGRFRRAACS